MYPLENLEITRISPREEGFFVIATYPGWHYEYNFFLQSDGQLKGKTSAGMWVELTQETASIIQKKFQTFLKR